MSVAQALQIIDSLIGQQGRFRNFLPAAGPHAIPAADTAIAALRLCAEVAAIPAGPARDAALARLGAALR